MISDRKLHFKKRDEFETLLLIIKNFIWFGVCVLNDDDFAVASPHKIKSKFIANDFCGESENDLFCFAACCLVVCLFLFI